ncbi:hypothetical protein I3843_01G187500 [Carya illinoinensis]|nr:hypothetical protein I3843_01G187500 [Carya illinoinensis]
MPNESRGENRHIGFGFGQKPKPHRWVKILKISTETGRRMGGNRRPRSRRNSGRRRRLLRERERETAMKPAVTEIFEREREIERKRERLRERRGGDGAGLACALRERESERERRGAAAGLMDVLKKLKEQKRGRRERGRALC